MKKRKKMKFIGLPFTLEVSTGPVPEAKARLRIASKLGQEKWGGELTLIACYEAAHPFAKAVSEVKRWKITLEQCDDDPLTPA